MTIGPHLSEERRSVDMDNQNIGSAPNEQALLALMERTGYQMIQENGQRKYGGPPPGWDGLPPRGCEVFVGKIPRDCYEDELVPIFEKIGRIYELRLMMDFSGTNRGYCFVMFTKREDAKQAVRELNNFEIRKGRYLGVCLSVDNCRLFVGGIPKNKGKEEILEEMKQVTEGVVNVIVYPSASDKSKNRGFAFVEYETHRAAAMARRKLIPGRIQLFGHQIAVDWAEPESDVDEDIMSKVKILYVRNLMLTTTEESLREAFQKASDSDGSIERVKKIRDYAFVHFRDRDDAIRAMEAMDGATLEGSMIEVVLAKPVDKSVQMKSSVPTVPGRGVLAQPGLLGYEQPALAINPFYLAAQLGATSPGSPGTTAAAMASLKLPGSPVIRGATPTRTPIRGRGRGAAGTRGAGGRTYLVRPHNKKHPSDGRLFDMHPDMVLTPTNPLTLKPSAYKSSSQILEELCTKNNWGLPLYQLHSTSGRDDAQLFLFKVSIPALGSIQPPKLCRTVDEAKNYAAECYLMQLPYAMEVTSPEAPSPMATSPTQTGMQAAAAAGPPIIGGQPCNRNMNASTTYSGGAIPTMQQPVTPPRGTTTISDLATYSYMPATIGGSPQYFMAAAPATAAKQITSIPQTAYPSEFGAYEFSPFTSPYY